MRFSTALLIGAAALQASAVVIPEGEPVLDIETKVLTDADIHGTDILSFGQDLPVELQYRSVKRCKYIPGDKQWPSSTVWKILKVFVGGRLENPAPIGSVCYAGANYNKDACTKLTASWSSSYTHVDHATSIMHPLYVGSVCLPREDPNAGTCEVGGYPVYVVNAKNVWDVQVAVNFARNANIRLVVKNTGHDFAGKSSGSHSLSIRTHKLKGISWIPSWKGGDGWTGPAFKIGAGVQGYELYQQTKARKVVVVGGEGETVGWGGGYIQGGGHSPLSSIMGMAADHVLSFDVVLANGRFVTASAKENSDLFWALRGGGGSTFGIVIATTVKAYPDVPATVSTFSFVSSNADIAKHQAGDGSNDDFWAVLRTYFSAFPAHADAGIYSYFSTFPLPTGGRVFNMLPFFAPNLSTPEVNELLAPMLATAKAHNITIVPQTKSYSTFYDAWKAGFPLETVGAWGGHFASRLWPRENFNDKNFPTSFDAIREIATEGYLIAFNIAPKRTVGKDEDTSFTPAWRNTVMHAIGGTFWDSEIRDSDPERVQTMMSAWTARLQKWRDLTPNSGAYLGEADVNEPNRGFSFWGNNYARLAALKTKLDPFGVFFAESAVGSEHWTTGPSKMDRLCPV